jgi:hypothetical protein
LSGMLLCYNKKIEACIAGSIVRYCHKFYENQRGKDETIKMKAAKRRKRHRKIKVFFAHYGPLCGKIDKFRERRQGEGAEKHASN